MDRLEAIRTDCQALLSGDLLSDMQTDDHDQGELTRAGLSIMSSTAQHLDSGYSKMVKWATFQVRGRSGPKEDQTAQAAVYARGVGIEDGSPLWIHGGERALRLGTEAMNANLAIGEPRTWSDQRSQFARGAPSCEIHLEEAILRVQEAGGASDVQAGGTPDRREAERVARDHHWRRQPFESKLAAERRQAPSQLCPRPHDGRSCAYGQQDRDREPYYPQSTTHRVDYGDYAVRPLF